jgi:DNA-binding IscR family transcriptional regulator
MAKWTFLTNHAHVLVCIARDPGVRVREIAERVEITERAAQRIVSELADEGYVERHREGRRNTYSIKARRPMRHPMDSDLAIGEILTVLAGPESK